MSFNLTVSAFEKLKKSTPYWEGRENCLKILVVYDTGSANRNTEKVAQAMSEVLKEKGFDVDCLYIKDVDPANVKNYDCVLAGSPTQWRRATRPITQFLDRLSKDELTGKLAGAFDTQLQAPLSGNAAKGLEKKLQNLGFKIVAPSLATYVEGREIRLKDGELEKAKKHAEDLANKLRP
jgi:flavorubredoxin